MKLGKITKVDLRDCWQYEDRDFTPWLAKEDNIQLLGDELGLDLEVRGVEKNVGPFRADILCVNKDTDDYVLIENQLDLTDHKHLGQILTYASGLDAVSIIWIAKRFTEEHRSTLDWLNRITDNKFSFIGIEIELIKIDDSPAAPIFNIVSKPNDWSKLIKSSKPSSVSDEEQSDTKQAQMNYWTELKEYLEKKDTSFRSQKPQYENWTSVAMGHSAFNMNFKVNSFKQTISIWLNFKENAKANFDYLYKELYDQSLVDIHPDVRWERMDNRKQSAVILDAEYDFMDVSTREEQLEWFHVHAECFIGVFRDKIKGLK